MRGYVYVYDIVTRPVTFHIHHPIPISNCLCPCLLCIAWGWTGTKGTCSCRASVQLMIWWIWIWIYMNNVPSLHTYKARAGSRRKARWQMSATVCILFFYPRSASALIFWIEGIWESEEGEYLCTDLGLKTRLRYRVKEVQVKGSGLIDAECRGNEKKWTYELWVTSLFLPSLRLHLPLPDKNRAERATGHNRSTAKCQQNKALCCPHTYIHTYIQQQPASNKPPVIILALAVSLPS